MNKYEQLIEYVINDEDSKARSLFHEIVVEKSRGIYEGLMDNEDQIGGDNVDQLINDVESDEQGFREDDEEMDPEMGGMGGDLEADPAMGGDDFGAEEPGMGMDAEEGELEDRVVDLEDKLDDLMAEFDSIVGGDEMGGDMEMEPEMGGDEFGTGEEEMGGDMEMEPEMEESADNGRHVHMHFEGKDEDLDKESEELEEELSKELDEAVSLTKVTKGISTSSESEGTNKTTINNDNSGKKLTGGSASPVNFSSTDEKGAGKVSYKDEGYTTEPRESKVSKGIANKSEQAGTDKHSLVKARK